MILLLWFTVVDGGTDDSINYDPSVLQQHGLCFDSESKSARPL